MSGLKSRLGTLLHSLGRYTHIDIFYAAQGGFWLTLGQTSTSLTVLALGIAFANLVPKDIYGTYKYALSIAGLLSVFTLPGMTTALIRAVGRGYEQSMRIASTVRMRYALMGSVLGLGAALYYYLAGNSTLALTLVIISFFLPVFDTFGTFYAFLQGKKLFRLYTIVGAVVQAGATLLLLIAILLTDNLFILVASYFGSYALLRFLSWRYVQTHFAFAGEIDPEMVPYAKHLSVMGVLGQLAAQADTLLAFHFLGAVEVAIYAVAVAPVEHLKNFISTINDLLLPRFAGHSERAIRSTMYMKCAVTFGVIVVMISAYALIAPLVFHLLFPRYPDAVVLTQIYALSLLATALMPLNIFLQAHGKVKELYYSNTLTSLIQIASVAAGVIFFGLIGLALARIVTRAANALLNLYFYLFPLTAAEPS